MTKIEIKHLVEERLGRQIPDSTMNVAIKKARERLDNYRERWPDVDYYDDRYLVALTADIIRQAALIVLTRRPMRQIPTPFYHL